MTRAAARRRRDDGEVRRALALVRPAAARVALSTLLGAGAACAAVGLLATSAWLIARAAQQPGASALGRRDRRACSSSRSRAGCCATPSGSPATTRRSGRWRRCASSVYRRLEPLAPAALPAFREGDLLARFVHDVDALQDLLLRVVPPFAIALDRRRRDGRAAVVAAARRGR